MKNLILAWLLLLANITCQAALIVVDSTDDQAAIDGNCTLRDALTAANFDIAFDECASGQGNDLIWLLITATNESITLNNQLPIISGVTIQGPGADQLQLIPSGAHNDHIFQINTDRDVSFIGFRIDGARSSAIDVVNVDELTINDMHFLNNSEFNTNGTGGAIHADTLFGNTLSINGLYVIDSEFRSNSAVTRGGAIAASGDYEMDIQNTLFEANVANNGGGAIIRQSGSTSIQATFFTIAGSTFNANTSNIGAAAIDVYVQNFNLDTSVFIANEGESVIHVRNSLSLVENSLFAENLADATVFHSTLNTALGSELNISFNTFLDNQFRDVEATGVQSDTFVFANVFATQQTVSCLTSNGGVINSNGFNVEAVGSSCNGDIDDLSDTDPVLLPLGLYGGNQLIAPPSPISPLVDASNNCSSADLSGEGRPRDGDASGGLGQCDIGAVERPNAYGLPLSFLGNGEGQVSLDEFDLVCDAPNTCFWPLPRNETFSFQPAAMPGSTFISWGGSCSGDMACDVTMTGNDSLSAEFSLVLNPVTLTVNKTGLEPNIDATVTSSPAGINCGANCVAQFVEGDLIQLIATPDANTVINSWIGCDSVSVDGLGCRVTLNTDTDIELIYDLDSDIIFNQGFE